MCDLQQFFVNANTSQSTTEYARQLKEYLRSKANVTWNKDLFIVSSYSTKFEKYNGTIFEIPENFKSEPKLVAYSFNYIEDYSSDHDEFIRNEWNNFRIEPIIDGSIMRLYNYSGTWRIATQNNVDANNVNWSSSENFGTLMQDAMTEVGLEYSALNPNYCYTFILQSPKNHMIIEYSKPNLILVNVTEGYNRVEQNLTGINNIPVLTFDTFDTLITELETEWTLPLIQESNLGYILTHTSGRRIRFESKAYTTAKRIKGNVPNISFRLLQVISEGNEEEFLKYFPKYQTNMEIIKAKITKMCSNLYGDFLNTKGPRLSNNLWNHTINELYYIKRDEGRISPTRIGKYLRQIDPNRLRLLLHITYFV